MTDYTELKRLATLIFEVQTSQDVPISKLFDDFEAAACPETILALIAQIEQDEMHLRAFSGVAETTIAERDQFRAENETFDDGMRALASTLGAGGYNAETLTATQLVEKVQWGVDRLAETSGRQIDELRAEVAGLKTGHEAYERVNAELKAENERIERNRDMWKGQVDRQSEELAALRGEVTEWKDTVKFNEKCWSEERGTMIDKLQESRMRIKELDLLFGRYILAMRSALIEEEHGKGPAAAMEWIYNSLAGPGELPPEGETDSQAYFDREIVAVDNGMQEVMAFHEGRRAALGQGEQS